MTEGSPLILDGEPVPLKWTETDQVRSRSDRLAATDAWGSWVAEMGDWHVFGALTYDQRRRETVPGADVAMAHVRRWLRESPRAAGVEVEAAVVALEYQRNGWPHFHPLMRVRGGLRDGALGALGQTWFRRHGYARLEPPRDTAAVAAYASKYLVKDLARGDVLFWPLRGSLGHHQPQLGGDRGRGARGARK